MKLTGVLPVLVLAAGCSSMAADKTPSSSPRLDLAGVTVTCNSWNGRHAADPAMDWKQVAADAPLVLKFGDGRGQPTISFPNAAFPAALYPVGFADAGPGLGLRVGGRVTYQSLSKQAIDTVTLDGMDTEQPRVVWQRFRLDANGAHPIALQGMCAKT